MGYVDSPVEKNEPEKSQQLMGALSLLFKSLLGGRTTTISYDTYRPSRNSPGMGRPKRILVPRMDERRPAL